ncbi:helix-turn-helix domain-containing protein [Vibrio alfacsensis]|uniref:helix-turn-helix domain-containing protein n=1 Tax=Vibrio alfacsensis TaxID=1074311 RepID=UPI0040695681
MKTVELKKHTSISTIIAEFLKQLRLYGADFVKSGGDVSKVDPKPESQETVAQALKITKAAYSKIENGDVAISVYHLAQLCIGYGITQGELMTCVDRKVAELEAAGIKVVNVKVTLRLDHLRWQAKLNEKTEANFNKAIRELKNKKTYSLYNAEQLTALRAECRQSAFEELDKKYDLGEAISEQELLQS